MLPSKFIEFVSHLGKKKKEKNPKKLLFEQLNISVDTYIHFAWQLGHSDFNSQILPIHLAKLLWKAFSSSVTTELYSFTNQLPFSCEKNRKQLLQGDLKTTEEYEDEIGIICKPS